MDHPIIESELGEELERHADIARQEWIATTQDDRRDEQMKLVDQPRSNYVRRDGSFFSTALSECGIVTPGKIF